MSFMVRKGDTIFVTASLLIALVASSSANAGDALVVGDLVEDPPTYVCLGVALPISGDDNYDARVTLAFRKESETTWREGLPLMRVRPETVPFGFGVSEQFAGSIFDLEPGTDYEVKLTIVDPDGVNVPEITSTLRTRTLPAAAPASARTVRVSSMDEWNRALSEALPGDVVLVADGRYTGSIRLTRSGTAENPVFVRGESRDGVVLDASGLPQAVFIGSSGAPVSHVVLEDFSIRGSELGIRVLGAEDVVIRRMSISEVSAGINATTYVESERVSYPNARVTICDNVLEGREVVWPNVDQAVWNFEGIVLEGQGHVVCYNRLSGFGDSLGIEICYGGITPNSYCPLYPPPNRFEVRNRSIDFYGNDVLFGGDDGIELDFAERNVRAFRNRIANTHMGISFQPVWGGPVYAVRNIMYNVVSRVYKLNNEPTGFYILHNTSIRNGTGWTQPSPSQEINNMTFLNNLVVGTSSALSLRTWLVMDYGTNNTVEMDYNGWFPDGPFVFLDGNFGRSTYNDIADLRSNTPLEANGVALSEPVFENADHVLGPISAPPLDPPADLTPDAASGAIDVGALLPNINDGHTGAGPDLGALERGAPLPSYGPRDSADPPGPIPDRIAPMPPTNLRVR